MPYDETEWTPAERAALERLRREEEPDPALEERTVSALKHRGLLGPGATAGSPPPAGPRQAGPRHAGRAPRAAWWAAGLAAALAVFFAGVALGQARSDAATRDLVLALATADAADRPALVQETGSLYVDAVVSLARLRARGEEEAVGTGVEVGIATLYAAAYELARLHPDDPRLLEVLRALEPSQAEQAATRDVHWF